MAHTLFRWNPFGHLFWRAFFGVIILELVSFLVFFSDWWRDGIFVSVIILIVLVALKNLRWGLFILFAELIVGGFGYLLWFQAGDFRISLRLGIFAAVFIAGFVEIIRRRKMELSRYRHVTWYVVFLLFIAWGVLNGFQKDFSLKDIFFDANGYFYFGLFFVFLETIRDWSVVEQIFSIWLAALSVSFLKVVGLLYLFTHQFDVFLVGSLYRWVRDTRVGEITDFSFFYRIFFQSHVYVVLLLFFIIAYAALLMLEKKPSLARRAGVWWIFTTILLFLIAVGYSRSFWIGMVLGAFGFIVLAFKIFRFSPRQMFMFLGLNIALLFLSIGLIGVVVLLPGLGREGADFSSISFLEERTTDVENELAAASRFALLQPLLSKVKEHWLLGSGFATAVSYQSQDPRALAQSGGGLFTTFSFEWGYLDTVTEIGLIGLLVYVVWLLLTLRTGFRTAKKNGFFSWPGFVTLFGCFGLSVLMVIHFFTPYLNHPLGIGYIMLLAAIIHMSQQHKYELA